MDSLAQAMGLSRAENLRRGILRLVLPLNLCGQAAALKFLDGVAVDPTHEVIGVDRDLRVAAIDRWLRRFVDQDLSLTDGVIFGVMRRRKGGPDSE